MDGLHPAGRPMTVNDDEYRRKRPIQPSWVSRIDTFVQLNWRLLLYAALMAFLLYCGVTASPEDPDFLHLDHWR
jgi:hypothetical protein